MKKKYVHPHNGVGSDIGIGSGGVDGDGSLVPETRFDYKGKKGIWELW